MTLMRFLRKLVKKLRKEDNQTMTESTAKLAHNWIKDADAILVTASNGLSISEGLNLFANDKKLKEVLGDLVDKYPSQNLLSALSFPYKNKLDHWRAIARIVEYYGNNYETSNYMSDIKDLVGNKPYFIWTSNIDHHFSLAGFKNVFEIEGNWFEGVCSEYPEEHGIYQLGNKLHEVYQKDQAGTLTETDIPTCDKCGSELDLNMAGDNFQVNQKQVTKLQNFLEFNENKKLVVLELGIGPRNKMIKMPTMQLVAANSNAHYITINQGQLMIPDEIADRSIGFDSSLASAFKELLSGKSFGARTQAPKKKEALKQLSPEEAKKQEKALQKFYPNYMVDQGFRMGTFPMYMTIDQDHPSYLHTTQYGQGLMYDMGDAAIVHCFTQKGQYYKIRLGLDKTKNEVHSFYVDPGTFIAIEDANDTGAGFSLINTEIPTNSNSEILVPKYDALLRLFPDQRDIIERLTVK